jgi:hypothetical protein
LEIKRGDLIHAGIVELSLHEADQNKMVKIPEETPSSALAGTDKMIDIVSPMTGNIFVSDKIVFPHGLIPGTSPKMLELFQRIIRLGTQSVGCQLCRQFGVFAL